MQHFATYPGSTFACGADATGQRNSRLDEDARATTCMRCLATDAWRAADARAAAAVPLFVALVVIPDEMELPSAVFGPFEDVEAAVAAGTEYARRMIAEGKWDADQVEDLEDVQVIAQPRYTTPDHLFAVESGK